MSKKEPVKSSAGRADVRFKREAKALQANLEKRKLQQKKRAALKKQAGESANGSDNYETNPPPEMIAAEDA